MFGWQGKLLRIDLETKKISIEDLKTEDLLDFLGGRGLGVKFFVNEVNADIDPFAPENKIVIAVGPLTGTGASSASLCSIVTKSPLTNTIISAQVKLYFGAELKAAGYDVVIIEGKALSPTLISIKDDDVSLLPADFLFDRPTDEALSLFQISFNDPWVARETRFLHIGPAGQKHLPLANLITDGLPVANSVGIGAVFGSKNLIGIAVRGTKDILLYDGEVFFRTVFKDLENLSENLKSFSDLSTYLVFEDFIEHNILACCYFIQPFASEVTLSQIKEIWKRHRGCFSCPIACLKTTQRGDFLPEIDAFMSLGPLCGIYDVKSISKIYALCIKLGLDPVETGLTISCAMAMKEKGLFDDESVPFFGDKKTILELIPKIAKKESPLANGAFKLCQELNNPDLFLGVKGRSIVFDVRNHHYLGLVYATSNCGATHLNGFVFTKENYDEIPQKVKLMQDKIAVLESLGICPYILKGISLENLLTIFQATTGITLTKEEFLKKGEEIYQIEHNFNEKAGIKRDADMLPVKFSFPEFEKILESYYKLRGW